MDIIPVIDLLDGQVVHAKCGDRANYHPIQSHLCVGSDPHNIVKHLLELYPFKRLYIADLNAIQGNGSHADIIGKIQCQYPTLDIWLDAGINNISLASRFKALGVQCIIGSESIADMKNYHELKQYLGNEVILSLDFNQHVFLGPIDLLNKASLWPTRVVVMTLSKVGSNSGPDLDLLKELKSRHPHVYAAGGVRNFEDLQVLAQLKVSGALVATLLHSGLLTTTEIETI